MKKTISFLLLALVVFFASIQSHAAEKKPVWTCSGKIMMEAGHVLEKIPAFEMVGPGSDKTITLKDETQVWVMLDRSNPDLLPNDRVITKFFLRHYPKDTGSGQGTTPLNMSSAEFAPSEDILMTLMNMTPSAPESQIVIRCRFLDYR